MKGYVEGRSPAAIFERYRNELWENCKALWTIWVPAQMVNFSVVPRHLRIPFGESAAAAAVDRQQQQQQQAAAPHARSVSAL
jgi:protein Mpv17